MAQGFIHIFSSSLIFKLIPPRRFVSLVCSPSGSKIAAHILAPLVRVKRDVYYDEQDHICAAFFEGERWILVDPTPSYGRINGWDIRHKEIELIELEKHCEALQNEEYQWFSIAMNKYEDVALSGILFAPWIHESIVYTD